MTDAADLLPERPPTVVTVWSDGDQRSFSPLAARGFPSLKFTITVPFPFTFAPEPVRGVVLRGLYADGPEYGPAEALELARRGERGFGVVDEQERIDR